MIKLCYSEILPAPKNQTAITPTQAAVLESRKCTIWNNANETRHEKCIWHNRSLKCNGNLDKLEIKSNFTSKIHHIVLCNWTSEVFDPSILSRFKRLRSLHMEYGSFAEIIGDFPHLPHLAVIRHISSIDSHNLAKLFIFAAHKYFLHTIGSSATDTLQESYQNPKNRSAMEFV